MARPLTRAQALHNRAFLKILRKTGNVRLACREVGLKYGTMQHRRRKHPAFALRWDAAMVFAQAKFAKPLAPKGKRDSRLRGNDGGRSVFRTSGGEMTICRRNDGRLQMRRAQPGKLTQEAEEAFLMALAATGNIRLAAEAVGAAFNSFNRRRRQDPAFAAHMRAALETARACLELQLSEATGAFAAPDDDDCAAPGHPGPFDRRLTVDEAINLLGKLNKRYG